MASLRTNLIYVWNELLAQVCPPCMIGTINEFVGRYYDIAVLKLTSSSGLDLIGFARLFLLLKCRMICLLRGYTRLFPYIYGFVSV